MKLDFKVELNKVYEQLGVSQIMVLATSSENRTTARAMSFVMYDEKLAFQTSKDLLKYQQIIENPRVAICFNNIQIEGIAQIKGHPLEATNKTFANLYQKYHKGSFDAYTSMKRNVLIEVTPIFITQWIYEQGEPVRKFIDITKEESYSEIYDHSF